VSKRDHLDILFAKGPSFPVFTNTKNCVEAKSLCQKLVRRSLNDIQKKNLDSKQWFERYHLKRKNF
jgi:hypothetical protein